MGEANAGIGEPVEEVVKQTGKAPMVSEQLVHIDLSDEQVQDAVLRVASAIQSVYPDAEFVSYIGTNPLGVYLDVYTEANDFSGILRALDERLGNLYVAAGVPVCVLPRPKAQAQAA